MTKFQVTQCGRSTETAAESRLRGSAPADQSAHFAHLRHNVVDVAHTECRLTDGWRRAKVQLIFDQRWVTDSGSGHRASA